jgi:undecaprenyl pyrophosphate phosphatase UppP
MGLIYGLISGFSELFPISASAHNILFTMFSGFTIPLLWRVTCHLGALLALLFFYRHQLKHICILIYMDMIRLNCTLEVMVSQSMTMLQ